MFSVPKQNSIKCDEGFLVEILGRTGVRYEDDVGVATVDGEILAGPSGFIIYRDSVRSVDSSTKIIDAARCDLIIENIRRAFAFRGFDIEIL
jgi:hypothetical protein